MSAVSAQTPHHAPVDNFIPDHLELKRTYVAPAKGTLPPIRRMAGNDLLSIPFTVAGNPGNLGFFCKQELVIQKALRLPIFFRLGSLEYCNRLEGK